MIDVSEVRFFDSVPFESLTGQTFTSVTQDECVEGDCIIFKSDNATYFMFHDNDCCENVDIDDICGDLKDLENSEFVKAEESSNSGEDNDRGDESFTWTFYSIRTIKGDVTIKWYGESNGYYSEDVSLYLMPKTEEAK